MYYNELLLAVEDGCSGRPYSYASLLAGHQDPIPNSDATRLRLDSPTKAEVPELA
jgi:hypothetical protein